MAGHRGLGEYRRKRDFSRTEEPRGARGKPRARGPIFVVQEHHARRLHFDFRLEDQGVLKSWAITREPVMSPAVRRLAIETEDHPLEYADFEGTIPEGEYGAGSVSTWDRGTFSLGTEKPGLADSIEEGHIVVFLKGRKLNGRFALIRLNPRSDFAERKNSWLFFKMKPGPGRPKF